MGTLLLFSFTMATIPYRHLIARYTTCMSKGKNFTVDSEDLILLPISHPIRVSAYILNCAYMVVVPIAYTSIYLSRLQGVKDMKGVLSTLVLENRKRRNIVSTR